MSTSFELGTMRDPLDLPPLDRMNYAFIPPGVVREHPQLSDLFEEIVTRMRREAEGITLETNQLLLLSKIATDYTLMKYYDEIGWGGQGTNARKDANTQWLAMMAEWRNVLKDNKEKISEKIVNDFIQLSVDSLGLIPDDDTRRKVQQFQREKFAALGY